ncbi:MAG: ComEA family DNA-binding protein [Candidatus Levybacteria bacterium]|nr:ComEA family DNA-binding protein [Candidatus Levybacteria bacterium]
MDSEKIYPLIRQNILPIALGVFGLMLVAVGLIQFIGKRQSEPTIVLEKSEEENRQEIVVDIEGAVVSPGVYRISADSRIVDALAAAGGLSDIADRDWVEKNINLAKKATDGLKIYIPREGEQILSVSSQTGQAGPVLNINTAGKSDLESLPGIGPVTAQKIIDGRPYTQIEDLLNRKIVGQATFEKIKEKISAD